MGIEINLEELEFYFTSLDKKLTQETMDIILKEGAKPVLDALIENVPTDTHELQESIGIIKTEGSGVDRKMHLGSTSKDREIVERAYYQEHGNSSMMGTKWISKSYMETKGDVLNIMSNKVAEVLNDK